MTGLVQLNVHICSQLLKVFQHVVNYFGKVGYFLITQKVIYNYFKGISCCCLRFLFFLIFLFEIHLISKLLSFHFSDWKICCRYSETWYKFIYSFNKLLHNVEFDMEERYYGFFQLKWRLFNHVNSPWN